jgi:hypothetical protein
MFGLDMLRLFQITVVLVLYSCSQKHYPNSQPIWPDSLTKAPDYKNLNHWAAHPWKKDPSDSVPKPLLTQKQDSLVDVFFIHPTTYTGNKTTWNAQINDSALNTKTDYSSILYQASVFNQHCRVFAPRYRQVHLSAFFVTNDNTKAAFDTAYSDLKMAFEFYLRTYNSNRAIIIAGHSQGALMAERLLKEFFDGKLLQKKLVVAYIIGWPIPQTLFNQIQVCKDSVQTNCFAGWRTFKKGYVPPYVQKEETTSFVTNPLAWTTTNAYVSAKQNKGSVLRDFSKIIPHTTDAQIYKGVLWSNRPRFPGSVFYRSKNYHVGDINLFYMNLRENIEQRIFSYFKIH